MIILNLKKINTNFENKLNKYQSTVTTQPLTSEEKNNSLVFCMQKLGK